MGNKRGCFKIGCGGCLVFLLIGAVVLAAGLMMASQIDHAVELEELTQALPVGVAPPGFLGEDSPNPLEGELDGSTLPLALLGSERGRLELDLSIGDFTLRPGQAGEPIRVQANYDTGAFELEEQFEPSSEHDGWVYHIRFGPKYGPIGLIAGGNRSRNPAKLEISLPPDVYFDLVGQIGLGEAKVELGGLALASVDLELGTGDHSFLFSEETVEPLENFFLKKSVGSLHVEGLGFSSPEQVRIEQKIGEARISLAGPWRNDGQFSAKLGMGELDLITGKGNTRFQLDASSVGIGDKRFELPDPAALPADAPTVSLRLGLNVGELSIDEN